MTHPVQFHCEICRRPLVTDLDDNQSYVEKSVEENVMFGRIITLTVVHQATAGESEELHYNIVVLDQFGRYRAHADSYIKPVTKKQGRTKFLGRVAAIGQGGAGKTRTIQEMANQLAGREVYSWNEEKNMAGTVVVTPYSLTFPGNRVTVFNDNPGQSSLELVRRAVAQAGANYRGFIMFQDATSWNFREVGLHQSRVIAEYIQERDEVPIAVITNKADLYQSLSRQDVLRHHAYLISETVARVRAGQKVGFFNRVKNQPREFPVTFFKKAFYFTQLEQVLVNVLQTDLRTNPIPGMTQINLRYYVRSILMGFAELVTRWMTETKLGEVYPYLNAFDNNLVTALNYYRPTAYETDSDWEVIHGAGKNEPFLLREIMDEESVRSIIRTFALGSPKAHEKFVQKVQQLVPPESNPDLKWRVVAHTYTDTVSQAGLQRIHSTFQAFTQAIEEVIERHSDHISDLNLQEFK